MFYRVFIKNHKYMQDYGVMLICSITIIFYGTMSLVCYEMNSSESGS